MKYPKPQAGNPFELAVRQHIIPAASIERFASGDGCVEVRIHAKQNTTRLRPDNSLFCANRAWDDRTEKFRFKRIEDAFQPLASEIATGEQSSLDNDQSAIATTFFALCFYRARARRDPVPDARQPSSTKEEPALTPDQLERLEALGVMAAQADGSIPGRFIASLALIRHIDEMCYRLAGLRWSVLRAGCGEFLVPDDLPPRAVMPIAPTVCLAAGISVEAKLDIDDVREINRLLMSDTCRYYFGRDLSRCPR